MKYLHSNMIIHRDIKSENILLTFGETIFGEKTVTAKIGDFGQSRLIDLPIPNLTRVLGTLSFKAPERYFMRTDIT